MYNFDLVDTENLRTVILKEGGQLALSGDIFGCYDGEERGAPASSG